MFLLLTSEEKPHLQLDNLDWPGKIGKDPRPHSLSVAGPGASFHVVKCLAIQEDEGATLESHLFTRISWPKLGGCCACDFRRLQLLFCGS